MELSRRIVTNAGHNRHQNLGYTTLKIQYGLTMHPRVNFNLASFIECTTLTSIVAALDLLRSS